MDHRLPMASSVEQRITQRIAEEIGARKEQVVAACALLDEGATVPFIARYRKEVTGGLDDTQLRVLDERLISDLVYLKLAMVELEPRHGQLMPAELSGGMVKRVALARALSLEPELLVLDEPTAGLDPDLADNFVKLIRSLQQQLGFTVIMVTHDLETLFGLASRVAVLADQRIIACGSPAEVMAVDHPFIHRFFGAGHAATIMQTQA